MASWVLTSTPWSSLSRLRFRLDFLAWARRPTSSVSAPMLSKSYFSSPQRLEETPSMIALKKQPYPSIGLDLSIFEDASEEYGADASVYPEIVAARTPCHVLARLVQDGKFADAERVLGELTEMGIAIELDFVYERAAMHILRSKHSSQHERLSAFVKWWSLVPSLSYARKHSFTAIQYAVLSQDAIPDLPLAMNFALIGASKGYAPSIAKQVVPFIFQYASPSTSAAFMVNFCQLDDQFLSDAKSRDSQKLKHRQRCATMWYGLAARTHCVGGRLDDAVKLLQSARLQNNTINRSTYTFLTNKLRQAQDNQSLAILDSLWRSQKEEEVPTSPRIALTSKPQTQAVRSDVSSSHMPSLPTALQKTLPTTPPPADASLAITLQYLRNSVKASTLPSPTIVAEFISAYKATGRSRALRILRHKFYRSHNRQQGTSIWALAEMLYHLERNERRGVLLVFAHHFHAIGVPVRVTKYLRKVSQRGDKMSWGNPDYVSRVVSPQYPLHAKLCPSSHHTAIVWQTIIEAIEKPEELENLYRELLMQVSLSRDPSSAPNPITSFTRNTSLETLPSHLQTRSLDRNADTNYLQPSPTPIKFDAVHFNLFIHAFAQRLGPSRSLAVIPDMTRFGINPTVQTLTMLAAGFARVGDTTRLMMLLDRMECSLSLSSSSSSEPSPSAESLENAKIRSKKSSSAIPPPNIITYTAIIRWLVNTERYEDATIIADRLLTKAGYVYGTNAITDQVLHELDHYHHDIPEPGN